jgi:hypothetical protein
MSKNRSEGILTTEVDEVDFLFFSLKIGACCCEDIE